MIAFLFELADMLSGLFVAIAAMLTVALALLVVAGGLWLAWRLVTLQANRITQRLRTYTHWKRLGSPLHASARLSVLLSHNQAFLTDSGLTDPEPSNARPLP